MKRLFSQKLFAGALIFAGAAFLLFGFAEFVRRVSARRNAGDFAEIESSPWFQAMTQGHKCEDVADWAGARNAYERAAKVMAQQPMLQSRAYSALCALYSALDLDDLAFQAAQKATQAARRDEEIPFFLPSCLLNEAEFHASTGDLPRAWENLRESLQLIEAHPLHELQQIHALILRAKIHLCEGDFAQASADLESVWQPLQPASDSFFMAGYQNALAKWWAVQAQLRAAQNDKTGAIEAWRQSVHRRRIIAQVPHIEGVSKHVALATTLERLAQSLRDAGDDLAQKSFAESHSIRRAIGLPAANPFG